MLRTTAEAIINDCTKFLDDESDISADDLLAAIRDSLIEELRDEDVDAIRSGGDKPWQVHTVFEGQISTIGPFSEEEDAMEYVARNNRTDDNREEYEFDLDDEYVYLQGPDRQLQSLSNSDFDYSSEDDDEVARYMREEEDSENGQDD